MTQKQAGLSALGVAYSRAYHAKHESPKIFDDHLAPLLFNTEEFEQTGRMWASLPPYIDPELAATKPDAMSALARVVQFQGAITLGRSRYTEDCLEAAITNGIRQYVILGAGMDTFAYRRPDLDERLQVFEVDHPATQALKQERVARFGKDSPSNLHYIAMDFTKERLSDALVGSAYDPTRLSFFGWLGVSYYLTREVVFDTLREIASNAAPGSTIVFDYMDEDAFVPEKTAKRVQMIQSMAATLGEPMKAGFNPAMLGAELARLGWRLDENLTPAEIEARYFLGRRDHYHAIEHIHFARAVVE